MKNYYTTKELCAILGVHRDTLRRWRRQGMPYKKLGGTYRFDMDEINAWIDRESERDRELERRAKG